MKISRKELEDLLYWDEEEELEEEEEELEDGMTWEEEKAYEESMKQLVIAGFAGDDMAWSIWSDMWKDLHGIRPRYSDDEIRRMYGLEEA